MKRLHRWIVIAMLIAIAIAIAIAVVTGEKESVNNSAAAGGGLYWSSTTTTEEEEETAESWDDGGFSSLDGMLQWAIGHSDPSKLKTAAEDVQRSSPDDLHKRRLEIKELIDEVKMMPSDAQLMRIAIDDLNNLSLPSDYRLRALEELSFLVEPIDNANDLHKLGGIAVVITELNHPDPEIRTVSALLIGKACQNNPFVQNQFLELGALAKLMKMAKSEFVEEAVKALFAVSALIRNNLFGQELFYAEAGGSMIQDILSKSNTDIRIQRKSVLLVADLAESQIQSPNNPEPPFFSDRFFLRSLVDLFASVDFDLQEKVLYAVKNLLMLQSTKALVFKEFCELDAALEKMRQRLLLLATEENHGEFAADMESLRREVEQIFIGKLNKNCALKK